jgi:hypothetical protein
MKVLGEAGKELETRFRWVELQEVDATARILKIVGCGWMNGNAQLRQTLVQTRNTLSSCNL